MRTAEQLAKKLRKQGTTWEQITDAINRAGFRTKRGTKFSRRTIMKRVIDVEGGEKYRVMKVKKQINKSIPKVKRGSAPVVKRKINKSTPKVRK